MLKICKKGIYMKLTSRSIPTMLTMVLTGVLFASSANATTSPMFIGDFTQTPSQPLQARMTSWNDPLFGEMGWTHHSGWGTFQATAGQFVTIKAVASTSRFHPAITVWYRGDDDTAPDNYVADHFYVQNANMYVKGATDETTQAVLGDISMKIVKYGFDKDSNRRNFMSSGVRDGVSGQLVLNFMAKKTGTYIFVVGGFSLPHATLDAATKYPIQTDVTIITPEPEALPAKK
jgi:hypothetical protein